MPGDTHTCFSCGDGDESGGLERSEALSCNNPCGTGNTAQCENIDSQISNFTLQFFGPISKTDDGMGNVTWLLPCGLDVGLASNPRAVGEGLACYFLRLFSGVIVANQGPQGVQGPAGTNGQDAFTVTVQNFNAPTPAAPFVQIITVPNSLFVPGLNIFVQGAGYFLITDIGTGGIIFAELIKPIANPPPIVPGGALVVPAGPPGNSIAGPQGPQGFTGGVGPIGPTGPVGPVGPSFPIAFAQFVPPGGAGDYTLTGIDTVVTFGPNAAQFFLGAAGTYLFVINIGFLNQFAPPSGAILHLQNITTASSVTGSTFAISGISNGASATSSVSFIMQTASPNNQLQLFAKINNTGGGKILAANTSMMYTRIT